MLWSKESSYMWSAELRLPGRGRYVLKLTLTLMLIGNVIGSSCCGVSVSSTVRSSNDGVCLVPFIYMLLLLHAPANASFSLGTLPGSSTCGDLPL